MVQCGTQREIGVILEFLTSDSLYPGWMMPDQDQRLLSQRLSWLDPWPRRGAGRMRQWDQVKRLPEFLHLHAPSNKFRQSR